MLKRVNVEGRHNIGNNVVRIFSNSGKHRLTLQGENPAEKIFRENPADEITSLYRILFKIYKYILNKNNYSNFSVKIWNFRLNLRQVWQHCFQID